MSGTTRQMVRTMAPAFLALSLLAIGPPEVAAAASRSEDDLSEARRLFEANLDAIRRRDRAAYLACYLDAPTMARTGIEGFTLGYASLEAQTSDTTWPDLFEARDLRLAPVGPGVVYGAYRYRVRYGAREESGLSERIFMKTDRGWRIAVTSAFAAPRATPPPPLVLAGATLVDGTGAPPVPDSVVIVRGGKIECAGTRRRCPLPGEVEVLDLSGLWITPGLIDAHVHFAQTGWADGRPDTLDVRDRHPYERVQAGLRTDPGRFFRAHLCSGVTSVFDVGGYPWTWDLRLLSESGVPAPHVAASGPLLSTWDHTLNLPGERQFIYIPDETSARDAVRYVAAHGTSAVKIWFIVRPGSDFEALAAAVTAAGDEARRAGLPLIVHATGLKEAKAALRAGARLLVHSVQDAPVDGEFLDLARGAGTIYCPTLIVRDGYVRMYRSAVSGEPPVVDDPGGCVDAGTLERVAETASLGPGKVPASARERMARRDEAGAIMAANLRRVRDAGIVVAMGTDAGNPLTLHGPSVYAEMEAMQAAGLAPMEVLVSATKGGALAMGRLSDLGTVEAGKEADLLVLASDPTAEISNMRRIRYVIRGGVVRSPAELKAPRP